jgi:hypothetical protein
VKSKPGKSFSKKNLGNTTQIRQALLAFGRNRKQKKTQKIKTGVQTMRDLKLPYEIGAHPASVEVSRSPQTTVRSAALALEVTLPSAFAPGWRAGSEEEVKRILRKGRRARLKSTRGPSFLGSRLLWPGGFLGRNKCTCSSLDSLYLGLVVKWAEKWSIALGHQPPPCAHALPRATGCRLHTRHKLCPASGSGGSAYC